MNILVVGAGPAGLYFAYLAKRAHPHWQIRVVEQNPADATFGFGVVFSDKALEFLRADDPATYDLITPRMEAWSDLTVVHRGLPVVIDGIGFAAIGRLELLRLLQQQLATVGVRPEFQRALQSAAELRGYDLVVAADGANSAVRRGADFGTTISHCTNKFVWYGTPRRFETLTQTFVRNEHGSVGNTVLIGDGLRTAHFSIGSGTRLAMEDGIALAKALDQHPKVAEALAAFEAARRPIVEKLVAAADASGAWYDRFAEH